MERRLFDAGALPRKRQRAITLPVSIAIHAVVVAAALIAPILEDDTLPEVSAAGPTVCLFALPPAPVAPPPPLRGDPAPAIGKPKLPPVVGAGMVAPPSIPEILPTEDPVGGGEIAGDPNGVVGGADWGARAGAIVGGLPAVPETVTKPVRISTGIHEPRKLRYVAPVYPALAQQIGLQGKVVLECTIDTRGRVVNASVVEGNPLLNDAAKAAVEQWLYTPTLLSGVPVPVLLQVSVTFTMH
jgi:protein TonB